MNKKNVRVILTVTALACLTTSLLGCSKTKETSSDNTSKNTETVSQKDFKYPASSDVELTYWVPLNVNVTASYKTLNETEFAKQLTKKTGIKVKYIHPAQGQQKEQFNLMLASGDLPDIIETEWTTFIGGPEKAIKDETILPLNDVIDKYAPNLKKYLDSHAEVKKMAKTDSGKYYMFPFVRGDEKLLVFHGPMVRADWLKELGLEKPTTIDEWENVLKAFKDKKGATSPLSFETMDLRWGGISGAFGTLKGYYVDNDKVKYGPMESGFKDFITCMNKWYKEGLLDKNFATVDTKILGANVLTGKTGIALGYNGGGLGKWVQSMQGKDDKFDLIAIPYPTLKKGETPKFGQKDLPLQGAGAAITKTSKNVELAARLLDFGYSEDGITLFNYGTEGVSHKMENGKHIYTDLIIKNPDKLTISQAMSKHMRTYSGPFVQQKEYIENYYQLQQQKDALDIWKKTEAEKHLLPTIYPTPEESSDLAKMETEIATFVDEMFLKFIIGTEPMSNYDKFTDQLKKLGIEKVLKIKQNALERYNKR